MLSSARFQIRVLACAPLATARWAYPFRFVTVIDSPATPTFEDSPTPAQRDSRLDLHLKIDCMTLPLFKKFISNRLQQNSHVLCLRAYQRIKSPIECRLITPTAFILTLVVKSHFAHHQRTMNSIPTSELPLMIAQIHLCVWIMITRPRNLQSKVWTLSSLCQCYN